MRLQIRRSTASLLCLCTIVALCGASLGCRRLPVSAPVPIIEPSLDQTEEANILVDRYNEQIDQANALIRQLNEIDEQLANTKFNKRERIKRLATQEADLLVQIASLYRQAADTVEQASKLRVRAKYLEYLSLKAQATRFFAEGVDIRRKYVEVLLGERTSWKFIRAQQKQLSEHAEKVDQQVKILDDQAKQIEREYPHVFKADATFRRNQSSE